MKVHPVGLAVLVQSGEKKMSDRTGPGPLSIERVSVKVIGPTVGASPMFLTKMVYVPPNNSGPVIVGVRSGTGAVVVVVVGGTVVVVVVVLVLVVVVVAGAVVVVVVAVGAVVVVVVAGATAAAGALGGHEDCAPARTSLVVSTIAPTAKTRTMTVAGPRRRRRRTIHTRATPAAMRRSASITCVEMLAPVKASEQFTSWERYVLKAPRCWIVTGRAGNYPARPPN